MICCRFGWRCPCCVRCGATAACPSPPLRLAGPPLAFLLSHGCSCLRVLVLVLVVLAPILTDAALLEADDDRVHCCCCCCTKRESVLQSAGCRGVASRCRACRSVARLVIAGPGTAGCVVVSSTVDVSGTACERCTAPRCVSAIASALQTSPTPLSCVHSAHTPSLQRKQRESSCSRVF